MKPVSTGAYDNLPLFKEYPRLAEKLAHVSLGEYPTPVQPLEQLGMAIDVPNLFTKREDMSGKFYGGNKIRALEFLFGDALRNGDRVIFALGFPASCQALAQAIYAEQFGMRSLTILLPQPISEQGRMHLLVYQSLGAELFVFPPLLRFLRHRIRDGRFPRLLEASTPLGVVGYVNAGFELSRQIHQSEIPEPDLIYVGLATMGTAVGLALGLKAAGITSQVIGVHLGHPRVNPARMLKLFSETNNFLRLHDSSFPDLVVVESDFPMRYGFARPPKTLLTSAGAKAIQIARDLADLQLDEMFTGNAFAALLADAEKGLLDKKTVLWWNSYSSRDLSIRIKAGDYHRLPRSFHRYFKER